MCVCFTQEGNSFCLFSFCGQRNGLSEHCSPNHTSNTRRYVSPSLRQLLRYHSWYMRWQYEAQHELHNLPEMLGKSSDDKFKKRSMLPWLQLCYSQAVQLGDVYIICGDIFTFCGHICPSLRQRTSEHLQPEEVSDWS